MDKIIFSLKILYISKKSSTFVPDFVKWQKTGLYFAVSQAEVVATVTISARVNPVS